MAPSATAPLPTVSTPGSVSATGGIPATGYPSASATGAGPAGGYPSASATGGGPAGGYPSASATGGGPAGGYPSASATGGGPTGGYPSTAATGAGPAGGYPSVSVTGGGPAGGYPSVSVTGGGLTGGYPSALAAGGSLAGTYPSAGVTGGTPSGAYPSATGGYPAGTIYPAAGVAVRHLGFVKEEQYVALHAVYQASHLYPLHHRMMQHNTNKTRCSFCSTSVVTQFLLSMLLAMCLHSKVFWCNCVRGSCWQGTGGLTTAAADGPTLILNFLVRPVIPDHFDSSGICILHLQATISTNIKDWTRSCAH